MNSPPKIPIQLQKQRQQRHHKLMKMINSYQLTRQQRNKLQKIKSHTMMQINLRFLRSQVNRKYKFPKFSKQTLNSSQQQSYLTTQDNDDEQDRLLKSELQQAIDAKGKGRKRPAQYFVYDLRSQNQFRQIKQSKELQVRTYSTKVLSLQQSRRVHSLGQERSKQKRDDMIIKRHNPLKNSNQRFAKSPPSLIQSKSTKTLKAIKPLSQTRKPSKQYFMLQQSVQKSPQNSTSSKNLLVQSRKLKLPQINSASHSKSLKKLNPIHNEKLKTQKFYQQEDIQYAIGKKLVTQTTDSGKKAIKGIQKYLKQLQAQKQQIYNNQGGRLMKKDKVQDKRKLNFNMLKSAKNSLKRQIQ